MAEQPRLDVLGPQGLLKHRVCQQVDLPDGQVVGSLPPVVQVAQLGFARSCHAIGDCKGAATPFSTAHPSSAFVSGRGPARFAG